MYPAYRPGGQKIQTDVDGLAIDRGFVAHFQVSAAKALAASAAGVLPLTNLGAQAQTITSGITGPVVPRGLSIVSNKGNAAGNVVVTGKNYADETITETLALNGTSTRNGDKAFKTVASIALPAQINTPVAQVETATAAGTVSTGGFGVVTVTAAVLGEDSPLDINFDVELGDDANAIAAAIRGALEDEELITDYFEVSGEDAAVILTRLNPAANDGTLNIAIDNGVGEGACEGITPASTSANTVAGVDFDKVSVGWNNKLGLPYKLAHNTVLAACLNNARETTAPTVAVSATAFESNTVTLHSSLAGQIVDVYLIV